MDHYMKSERNVNVWDCSTLFVLICHVLTDVTRCRSSYRGYKYVKNDLAGGSSYRGFELQRAKLFKQIVRPGFNRRSLRVHDFEDGKAPRQSLEILFYQNQCSSKLNYRCKLAFLRNVLLYPKVSSLFLERLPLRSTSICIYNRFAQWSKQRFRYVADLLFSETTPKMNRMCKRMQHRPESLFSWLVCVCAAFCQAVNLGFAFSYGVLLPEVMKEFGESRQKTGKFLHAIVAMSENNITSSLIRKRILAWFMSTLAYDRWLRLI